MREQFLVRVGALGAVGCYESHSGGVFQRDTRVLCRTPRGLEIGHVLANTAPQTATGPVQGTLVRKLTVADELLAARLEQNRSEACQACIDLLHSRGIDATLLDAEALFDGTTLVFYFLGNVTPQIEEVTQELADRYETKVQFRQFAEALTNGCGPDCGTDEATGCGTGCASCVVAAACHK